MIFVVFVVFQLNITCDMSHVICDYCTSGCNKCLEEWKCCHPECPNIGSHRHNPHLLTQCMYCNGPTDYNMYCKEHMSNFIITRGAFKCRYHGSGSLMY